VASFFLNCPGSQYSKSDDDDVGEVTDQSEIEFDSSATSGIVLSNTATEHSWLTYLSGPEYAFLPGMKVVMA
jgi:hypothetical protein